MNLLSIIAILCKAARAPFSSPDPSKSGRIPSLTNGRGESPCPVPTSEERSETLYSVVNARISDCNCNPDFKCPGLLIPSHSDRAFLKLASACVTCRSNFAPVLACRGSGYTPPYEPASSHMSREVMKPADIPKWTIRDSGDSDPASAPQSSRGWTAAQILTPVVVGIALCLAFTLWLLYQRGRLSRLTSILPSMRRNRQGLAPRRWSYGNDAPGSGALPRVPDAEATPMIDPLLHWRSLSPKDDAAHRQRLSTRMRMGALTPAFSKAIRSIRRLFGWGPIPVSRAPVSDTFDIEDTVTETDPFGTLKSNASKSWRNGLPNVGQVSGSTVGRVSTQNLPSETSWSSATLDLVDNIRGNYEDTANDFEDGGANDHDNGTGARNGVMLISRNGEDFSLGGSMLSEPMGKKSIEVDRRSIEVVPPTPTISERVSRYQLHGPRAARDHLTSQPFHQNPSLARSVSTPLLRPSSSERPLVLPFSPSTNDLSPICFHPVPKSSFISPTHFATRPAALSGVQFSREDLPILRLYTTAAPPVVSAGPSPYRSPKTPSTLALPSDAHSRSSPAGYSPSPSTSSPDLQNYIPSFLGRSSTDSHYLPSSPVPSSLIHPSDPQNLIPSAVRGAGYNPFRHARSVSAFK